MRGSASVPTQRLAVEKCSWHWNASSRGQGGSRAPCGENQNELAADPWARLKEMEWYGSVGRRTGRVWATRLKTKLLRLEALSPYDEPRAAECEQAMTFGEKWISHVLSDKNMKARQLSHCIERVKKKQVSQL